MRDDVQDGVMRLCVYVDLPISCCANGDSMEILWIALKLSSQSATLLR